MLIRRSYTLCSTKSFTASHGNKVILSIHDSVNEVRVDIDLIDDGLRYLSLDFSILWWVIYMRYGIISVSFPCKGRGGLLVMHISRRWRNLQLCHQLWALLIHHLNLVIHKDVCKVIVPFYTVSDLGVTVSLPSSFGLSYSILLRLFFSPLIKTFRTGTHMGHNGWQHPGILSGVFQKLVRASQPTGRLLRWKTGWICLQHDIDGHHFLGSFHLVLHYKDRVLVILSTWC